MATYFTKTEARRAATSAQQQHKRAGKLAGRILKEEAASATDHEIFDIFLSHASKDSDLVLGTKAILESLGYKVYVDWIDDAQLDRSNVNIETADLLRRRMRQSNSLVWVDTEAATESKWMPWELGYFDGFKPKHVSILPLTNNSTDKYKGQEYLSLYPVITQDHYQGGGSHDVFVESAGREWTTLRNFAAGTAKYSKYNP